MDEAPKAVLNGTPTLSADKVIETIKRLGITHVIYLADFMQGYILDALVQKNPEIKLIMICREGEAIPIATGLWMAGRKPLVMHQNAGLLEAGDAVTAIGIDLRIPIFMMIGYRGYRRSRAAEMWDPPARYIEPVLRALDVPYEILEGDDDIHKIESLYKQAYESRRPTAALIAWEAVW